MFFGWAHRGASGAGLGGRAPEPAGTRPGGDFFWGISPVVAGGGKGGVNRPGWRLLSLGGGWVSL